MVGLVQAYLDVFPVANNDVYNTRGNRQQLVQNRYRPYAFGR